jgi:glycosyltransferase involved in cell wall biosynthesis
MASVSVIIPTFNRCQKVARAVASVLFQTISDYEIIVVDDGSTDNTSSALKLFGSQVTVITHPHQMGVSAARNTGVKSTTSPLIAFLDSDDYWLPEKLAAQVSFFREHSEAVACQTQEKWIRKGLPVNPKRKHLKPSGHMFSQSLKLCLVSPSAVMLRRSLLEDVGLFDEAFPCCEDYDLWLRVTCRYPVHLIDEALVVKEGGSTDQLSMNHPGMDRYRIKAIVKMIESGWLNDSQVTLALEELSVKCSIYGKGCIKRGKRTEGEHYLRLPEQVRELLKGREGSSFSMD